MEKVEQSAKAKSDDFKNAHLLSEFSKKLQSIGGKLEDSVALFDSIGTKNEIFESFEKSMNSITPSMEVHDMSKKHISDFVFSQIALMIIEHKDDFDFVHIAQKSKSELVFFLSTQKEDLQEALEEYEFDYATGDFSEYIDLSFCFLEKDMESGLSNTEKLIFDA